MVTVVARTTSIRGTRFEVEHRSRNFKTGAFDAQSIATSPTNHFVRRLGVVPDDVLIRVEDAVRLWLAL